MNSGLQCLLASPLVSSTLVSDIKNKGSIDGDIALSFKRIIESRERGKVTSDELRSLKRNVATQNDRFIGNNQEDVVEFISTLIDGIDKYNIVLCLLLFKKSIPSINGNFIILKLQV